MRVSKVCCCCCCCCNCLCLTYRQVKSYVLKFWIGNKIAPPVHPDVRDVQADRQTDRQTDSERETQPARPLIWAWQDGTLCVIARMCLAGIERPSQRQSDDNRSVSDDSGARLGRSSGRLAGKHDATLKNHNWPAKPPSSSWRPPRMAYFCIDLGSLYARNYLLVERAPS